jgi:hypothetical protein
LQHGGGGGVVAALGEEFEGVIETEKLCDTEVEGHIEEDFLDRGMQGYPTGDALLALSQVSGYVLVEQVLALPLSNGIA